MSSRKSVNLLFILFVFAAFQSLAAASILAQAKLSNSNRQAASGRLLPPVYFNHLFVTLDNQTYSEITQSEFMRNQFANFEERTTTSNAGESWTGGYFYGEHTYFELFNIEKNPGFKIGESGIAFGVEEVGGIELIYDQLKTKVSEKVKKILRTRKIENKDIPWFYEVGVDYEDATLTLFTWVMEYHKDYLKNMYPDLKPEKNGIMRRQNLAPRFDQSKFLKDVYEATIALDDKQASRFLAELKAFGYVVKDKGKKKICKGPDIKFIVVPPIASISKITELKISLLREKEGQKTYGFGTKSTLEFKGKTAIWRF